MDNKRRVLRKILWRSNKRLLLELKRLLEWEEKDSFLLDVLLEVLKDKYA